MIIHLKKMLAGHSLRGDWKQVIKLLMLSVCTVSLAPVHAMNAKVAPRLAIINAALNGDLQKVVKLIKKDKSCVNQLGGGKWTPLMSAASAGHFAICRLLVVSGADIHARCQEGCCNALSLAAKNGHERVCELLRNCGASLDFLWPDAVQTQNIVVIRNLIQSGMDVNIPVGSQNETALFRAAQNGDENIAVTMLLNKADVNKARTDGFNPLMIAIKNGHTKIAQLLIQRGADVNARVPRKVDDITALSLAVESGNTQIVKLLLEKGADINGGLFVGIADLCLLALSKGHMEIYNMLSEAWGEI